MTEQKLATALTILGSITALLIAAEPIITAYLAARPQARDRATVPAVPDTAQAFHTYMPGDIAPATGVYFPVGQLVRRDPDVRVSPVTRGQAIAHEVYLEGEPLPELVGFLPGAVWVREPAR